jgi:propanol-preferring alcohol dehydrogenase
MSDVMIKAMVLEAPNRPLHLRERPMPEPTGSQLLIKVSACGVCRGPPSARR